MTEAAHDVHASLPAPVELEVPQRLTAAQIRSAADSSEELVPVPEWGGAVLVRSLTLDDAAGLADRAGPDGEMDSQLLAKLTLIAACPDLDESAVEWLGKKNPAALKRLFEAVKRLQGISAEEVAIAAATFPDAARAVVRAQVGGEAGPDGG
jgi:hypothetical protein